MNDKYFKDKLEPIVIKSKNWTEVLRALDMVTTGNSRKTLKKYVKLHNISTSHFESKNERHLRINGHLGKMRRILLSEILISGSTYTTTHLKNRLYDEGLKERKCEMCGQNENWHGKHISLILDHINGINNDHRIENLRIVCPNCNASLSTHCGKLTHKKRIAVLSKKERPSYETLLKEVNEIGYSATGRKYGVSDNSIRKWIKLYEKYKLSCTDSNCN